MAWRIRPGGPNASTATNSPAARLNQASLRVVASLSSAAAINNIPGTNATAHNNQAVAWAWLARPSRSAGSSGSMPMPRKARPASTINCPPTRRLQLALGGMRASRLTPVAMPSAPTSTKATRLKPSACGTPCAPSSATGWLACR